MVGYKTGYGQGEKYNPRVKLIADGPVALHAERIRWVSEQVQQINALAEGDLKAEARITLYEAVLDWMAQGDVADSISLAVSTMQAASPFEPEPLTEEQEPESYGGY